MSDPFKQSGMSVTLKQDGKDGTWTVFHGTPQSIREQLIETFVLDPEREANTPLFDLINEVTKLYKSSGNVSRQLGGRVLRDAPPTSEQSSGSSGGSAWQQVASEPQESPEEKERKRLLEEIEKQPHVKALKELWAKNQEAFAADELMTAYRTKGKALKEAGLLE